MSAYAVKLENVSKKYRLFRSTRERVLEALHPFRKTYHREFWALSDISVEIPTGSAVGILGLNGSGKSTLLQIISSVLRPTSGSVTVNGKVAALLELGAGLNPQLSGRENVVMSSAIMGFDEDRTLRRMEEIEQFADIGEFFEQPMKTYSSGMYMRVAFATSIFVDPDILIIDEALAVGDGKFAEKCFAKIKKFRDDGKSILIVTHDRSTVPRICDRGILLHHGKLVEAGTAQRIVDLYTEIMAFGDIVGPGAAAVEQTIPADAPTQPDTTIPPLVRTSARTSGTALEPSAIFDAMRADKLTENPLYNKYEYRFGNGQASIDGFWVVQDGMPNPVPVRNERPIDLYVRVAFRAELGQPLVGIRITSAQGVLLYSTHSGWLGKRISAAAAGSERCFKFSFTPRLGPGDWFVELAVAANPADMCDVRSKVIHFEVSSSVSFDGLAMIDTEFSEVPYSGVEPAAVSARPVEHQ